MEIRPAVNDDQSQIQQLITLCFAEYGEQLCLDDSDRDLLDLSGHYVEKGGAIVVLEDQGRIRATHAVLPMQDRPQVCTFRRLYLDPDLRGSGWGDRLMEWALQWAAGHAMKRVEFWSDARFKRAHRFFVRHGFQTDGRTREMNDSVEPYNEYFFFQDLDST